MLWAGDITLNYNAEARECQVDSFASVTYFGVEPIDGVALPSPPERGLLLFMMTQAIYYNAAVANHMEAACWVDLGTLAGIASTDIGRFLVFCSHPPLLGKCPLRVRT